MQFQPMLFPGEKGTNRPSSLEEHAGRLLQDDDRSKKSAQPPCYAGIREVHAMIAFEVAFLFAIGIVAIVTIAAIGRPLAEAYSEKLKARYRELAPEKEEEFRKRLAAVEGEVIELKRQLTNAQGTADFALKLIEEQRPPQMGANGAKVKLPGGMIHTDSAL